MTLQVGADWVDVAPSLTSPISVSVSVEERCWAGIHKVRQPRCLNITITGFITQLKNEEATRHDCTTLNFFSGKSLVLFGDWQVRRWRRPTRTVSEVAGILSTYWKQFPNLVFGEAALSQATSRLAIKPTFTLTAELPLFSKQFYVPECEVLTQSGMSERMFNAESSFSQRLSRKCWKNTLFFFAQCWLLLQEPVVSVA